MSDPGPPRLLPLSPSPSPPLFAAGISDKSKAEHTTSEHETKRAAEGTDRKKSKTKRTDSYEVRPRSAKADETMDSRDATDHLQHLSGSSSRPLQNGPSSRSSIPRPVAPFRILDNPDGQWEIKPAAAGSSPSTEKLLKLPEDLPNAYGALLSENEVCAREKRDLECEVGKLRSAHAALRVDLKEMAAAKADVEASLLCIEETAGKYYTEKEGLGRQTDCLTLRVADLEAEKKSDKMRLEELLSTNNHTQMDSQQLRLVNETLTNALRSSKDESRSLQTRLWKLEQKVAGKEGDDLWIGTLDAENEGLKLRIEELLNEMDALRSALDERDTTIIRYEETDALTQSRQAAVTREAPFIHAEAIETARSKLNSSSESVSNGPGGSGSTIIVQEVSAADARGNPTLRTNVTSSSAVSSASDYDSEIQFSIRSEHAMSEEQVVPGRLVRVGSWSGNEEEFWKEFGPMAPPGLAGSKSWMESLERQNPSWEEFDEMFDQMVRDTLAGVGSAGPEVEKIEPYVIYEEDLDPELSAQGAYDFPELNGFVVRRRGEGQAAPGTTFRPSDVYTGRRNEADMKGGEKSEGASGEEGEGESGDKYDGQGEDESEEECEVDGEEGSENEGDEEYESEDEDEHEAEGGEGHETDGHNEGDCGPGRVSPGGNDLLEREMQRIQVETKDGTWWTALLAESGEPGISESPNTYAGPAGDSPCQAPVSELKTHITKEQVPVELEDNSDLVVSRRGSAVTAINSSPASYRPAIEDLAQLSRDSTRQRGKERVEPIDAEWMRIPTSVRQQLRREDAQRSASPWTHHSTTAPSVASALFLVLWWLLAIVVLVAALQERWLWLGANEQSRRAVFARNHEHWAAAWRTVADAARLVMEQAINKTRDG